MVKKKFNINHLFSKCVIVFVIVLNVVFTYGVLKISNNGNTVPDSLIVGFFAWTTGELWVLGNIHKAKTKNNNNGSVVDTAVNVVETALNNISTTNKGPS